MKYPSSIARTVSLIIAAGTSLSSVAQAQDADQLEEVVITAIVDAATKAAEQQKNARGVTNVVSADTVGRFPDPNIAEALQRVAGIAIARDQGEGRYINVRGGPSEFSAVTIDGVSISAPDPTTRAIDLDTIPSDIVGLFYSKFDLVCKIIDKKIQNQSKKYEIILK